MAGEQTHRVALLLEPARGEHSAAVLERVRSALGDGRLTDPDEAGLLEAEVPAPSFEAALERVWDAVAAAGADDHVRFAEHPGIPEHWRHRVAARPH